MNALARAWHSVPFIGRLVEPAKTVLAVTEGLSGLQHYHVSTPDERSEGLAGCGARVMSSSVDLEDWGRPFGDHSFRRPTFCTQCARLHAEAIAHAIADPVPARSR